MLTGTKLQDALSGIVVRSLNRRHSRVVTTATLLGMVSSGGGLPAVVTRLNPNLLYAGGPSLTGGRYTPVGGPEALYLGSSERVANAEWASALKELFPGMGLPPKTVFQVKVTVTRLLDVSIGESQAVLGTNSPELNCDWKSIKHPATHVLGLAVHESRRFSALRYRSTKEPRGHCLLIFPDRLISGERVEVVDPTGVFSWSPLVGH
jgi:hypothetical protein